MNHSLDRAWEDESFLTAIRFIVSLGTVSLLVANVSFDNALRSALTQVAR